MEAIKFGLFLLCIAMLSHRVYGEDGCATSEYGCCSDGVTAALDDTGGGCSSGKILFICLLPPCLLDVSSLEHAVFRAVTGSTQQAGSHVPLKNIKYVCSANLELCCI